MEGKQQLKFNLSFKKSEIDLYKAAVEEQRSPASFIKDAIEFYLKFLNGEIELKNKNNKNVPKEVYLEEHSETGNTSEVETNDLLNF